MTRQTYNLSNARALRYLVQPSLELFERKGTIHNGLNFTIRNVLDCLLEIVQSRSDRSHDALLVHNQGDGVASEVMILSSVIPNEDEPSSPPESTYPPNAGIHGLPPTDALEDDVGTLAIGVVPNSGGYGRTIEGPINGKVSTKLDSLFALGL